MVISVLIFEVWFYHQSYHNLISSSYFLALRPFQECKLSLKLSVYQN